MQSIIRIVENAEVDAALGRQEMKDVKYCPED